MSSFREKIEEIIWKTHHFTHFQGDYEWTTQEITEKEAADQIISLVEELIGDDESVEEQGGFIRNNLRKQLRSKIKGLKG